MKHLIVVVSLLILSSISAQTKNPVEKEEFEWTVDSTIGFKCPADTAASKEKTAEKCTIPQEKTYTEVNHRMALLVDYGSSPQQLTFKLMSSDRSCKNVYIDDEIQKKTVKGAALNTLTVNKTKIAVFDPHCKVYVKRNENDNNMRNVFVKYSNVEELSQEISSQEPIVRRMIMSSSPEKVGDTEKNFNHFFPFPELQETDGMECYHHCKYGQLLSLKMKAALSFANMFKLKDTCEWMSIILNVGFPHETVEISLRHGFVVFQKEVRANVINFKNDAGNYEVGVSFYTVGSKAFFIVTNGDGQAVKSSNPRVTSDEIRIAFSQNDCLINTIGDDKNGVFKKERNIGNNIALSESKFKALRYAKNVDSEQLAVEKAEYKPIAKTDIDDKIQKLVINEIDNTANKNIEGPEENRGKTTEAIQTIDPNKNEAETTPAPTRTISKEDFVEKHNELQKALQGEYYKTWGIPAGFFAGSFASFVICNIILLIFKRSVLMFWYKAMYKRYGSDTTMGTTMGKTMGGETIGGGTTTVGATTMGGTTAGETAGSTMAAYFSYSGCRVQE